MFIDTHCHLNLEQFDTDWEQIVAQMSEQGIRGFVVGVDAQSSQRALMQAGRYPETLRAIVGIHPAYVTEIDDIESELDAIAEMSHNNLTVGIGECGFDFFRVLKTDSLIDLQNYVFMRQVKIAHNVAKPVMIHCRPSLGQLDAYDNVLDTLNQLRKDYPVVPHMHFFAGTVEHVASIVTMDGLCSFTGVVTFTDDYNLSIQALPVEHIVCETDSPYVAPVPYRGERCNPLYVTKIYKAIAEQKGMPMDAFVEQVKKNVERIYCTWS